MFFSQVMIGFDYFSQFQKQLLRSIDRRFFWLWLLISTQTHRFLTEWWVIRLFLWRDLSNVPLFADFGVGLIVSRWIILVRVSILSRRMLGTGMFLCLGSSFRDLLKVPLSADFGVGLFIRIVILIRVDVSILWLRVGVVSILRLRVGVVSILTSRLTWRRRWRWRRRRRWRSIRASWRRRTTNPLLLLRFYLPWLDWPNIWLILSLSLSQSFSVDLIQETLSERIARSIRVEISRIIVLSIWFKKWWVLELIALCIRDSFVLLHPLKPSLGWSIIQADELQQIHQSLDPIIIGLCDPYADDSTKVKLRFDKNVNVFQMNQIATSQIHVKPLDEL